MVDYKAFIEELEGLVEKEERIAQRELRSCWGMPSGLEPAAFEEARARERMYKRWIKMFQKELEHDDAGKV